MAKLASVIVPRPLKVSRGAKIGHGPFVPEAHVLRNRPSAVRAVSSTAILSSSAASRSPVIAADRASAGGRGALLDRGV